jgi:hypothetical protein
VSLHLSPGQKRIRQIIGEFLPTYLETELHSDASFKIIKQVRQRFAEDLTINTDPLTSADLRHTPFSENYLEWLRANSSSKILENQAVKVDLTNFIYSRRDSDTALPRYEGGVSDGMSSPKWRSTFETLFSLAANIEIPNFQMDVAYFSGSRIVTVEGGGNHRLLAHVLWGEQVIKPEFLHEYQEMVQPDLELNQVFCVMDQLSEQIGSVFKLDSYNDAQPIKEFFRKSSDAERQIIAAYMAYLSNRLGFRAPNDDHDGVWLLKMLFELCQVSGLSSIRRAILEKIGLIESLTDFQYWYKVLHKG